MKASAGVTIGATIVTSVGLVMVDVGIGLRDPWIQLVTVASGAYCTGMGVLAVIGVLRYGPRGSGRA